MFQLHLPRYSSPEMLRNRLLQAMQNSGSSDQAAARPPHEALDDEEEPLAVAPSATAVLRVPDDGGHSEGIDDMFARAGFGRRQAAAIKSSLGVKDIKQLLEKTQEVPGMLEKSVGRTLRLQRLAKTLDGPEP